MNDNLCGVQDIRWSASVDLSKGIVVCPFSLFISFSLFSLFLYFFGGLNGSFYFSHLSSLGSLRKEIRRFMMTERIVPRVWMYRRRWTPTLGVRKNQCTAQEWLEKYGKVEVSTFEYSH